jgi:quercetin dioxygenase-like cupin family protein
MTPPGGHRGGYWLAMSGYVHGPGDGDSYDWHGARMVIKASGHDTAGQLSVIECTYPPGLAVHPHVHDGEDEMFYVLAGELRGFCEDDEWTAGPGTFVFVPRDCRHAFTVSSAEPARAIVVVGPPRLDGQIAATGTPVG